MTDHVDCRKRKRTCSEPSFAVAERVESKRVLHISSSCHALLLLCTDSTTTAAAANDHHQQLCVWRRHSATSGAPLTGSDSGRQLPTPSVSAATSWTGSLRKAGRSVRRRLSQLRATGGAVSGSVSAAAVDSSSGCGASGGRERREAVGRAWHNFCQPGRRFCTVAARSTVGKPVVRFTRTCRRDTRRSYRYIDRSLRSLSPSVFARGRLPSLSRSTGRGADCEAATERRASTVDRPIVAVDSCTVPVDYHCQQSTGATPAAIRADCAAAAAVTCVAPSEQPAVSVPAETASCAAVCVPVDSSVSAVDTSSPALPAHPADTSAGCLASARPSAAQHTGRLPADSVASETAVAPAAPSVAGRPRRPPLPSLETLSRRHRHERQPYVAKLAEFREYKRALSLKPARKKHTHKAAEPSETTYSIDENRTIDIFGTVARPPRCKKAKSPVCNSGTALTCPARPPPPVVVSPPKPPRSSLQRRPKTDRANDTLRSAVVVADLHDGVCDQEHPAAFSTEPSAVADSSSLDFGSVVQSVVELGRSLGYSLGISSQAMPNESFTSYTSDTIQKPPRRTRNSRSTSMLDNASSSMETKPSNSTCFLSYIDSSSAPSPPSPPLAPSRLGKSTFFNRSEQHSRHAPLSDASSRELSGRERLCQLSSDRGATQQDCSRHLAGDPAAAAAAAAAAAGDARVKSSEPCVPPRRRKMSASSRSPASSPQRRYDSDDEADADFVSVRSSVSQLELSRAGCSPDMCCRESSPPQRSPAAVAISSVRAQSAAIMSLTADRIKVTELEVDRLFIRDGGLRLVLGDTGPDGGCDRQSAEPGDAGGGGGGGGAHRASGASDSAPVRSGELGDSRARDAGRQLVYGGLERFGGSRAGDCPTGPVSASSSASSVLDARPSGVAHTGSSLKADCCESSDSCSSSGGSSSSADSSARRIDQPAGVLASAAGAVLCDDHLAVNNEAANRKLFRAKNLRSSEKRMRASRDDASCGASRRSNAARSTHPFRRLLSSFGKGSKKRTAAAKLVRSRSNSYPDVSVLDVSDDLNATADCAVAKSASLSGVPASLHAAVSNEIRVASATQQVTGQMSATPVDTAPADRQSPTVDCAAATVATAPSGVELSDQNCEPDASAAGNDMNSVQSSDSPAAVSQQDDLDSVADQPGDKAFLVAREMMTSEQTFLDALQLLNVDFCAVIEQAMGERCEWVNAAGAPVSLAQVVKSVLGILPQLQQISASLVAELRRRVVDWPRHRVIADVLVRLGPFLKLYSIYIENFVQHCDQLEEYKQRYPAFYRAVVQFESSERCCKLSVVHYMLKPVQRVPQYRLLLEDYLRHLTADSPDYDNTRTALTIVTNVAQHINENMKHMDKFRCLLQLQQRIGCTQIVRPGRFIIKEGSLSKMCRKGPQLRYVVLLTDILLLTRCELLTAAVTSASSSVSSSSSSTTTAAATAAAAAAASAPLQLDYLLPLASMRLAVPPAAVDEWQTEFSVLSTSRSFSLIARTPEERNEWMTAIAAAIAAHTAKRGTFHVRTDSERDSHVPAAPADGATDGATVADADSADKIGEKAPLWVPDSRASMCQLCATEFTVRVRRHHCRACGKLVCSSCSSQRYPLAYRNNDRARVCDSCADLLEHNQSQMADSSSDRGSVSRSGWRKNRRVPKRLEVEATDATFSISGYLQWRSRKQWKRRWFVLRARVLYVYRAPHDLVAESSVPVLGYTVERLSTSETGAYKGVDSSLVFQLTHANQSPVVFQADSANAVDKWVSHLQSASVLS